MPGNKVQRWIAIATLPIIAAIAVGARYFLFSSGTLYGQAASKMASLTVAGVIVLAGVFPLWAIRSAGHHDDESHSGQEDHVANGGRESLTAVVTAVLGLATTAYGVSELLAPNTPVAAAAPACSGAPVYGAEHFSLTQGVGANARAGAGRDYSQTHRYGGACTLGFDGYCIGPSEPDFILKTPDQRWLVVHNRNEVIASGAVLSQTAESMLGSRPHPKCDKLGGQQQPDKVQRLSYDSKSGKLSAVAPKAVAVGYVLASSTSDRSTDKALGYGSTEKSADFSVDLKVATIATIMRRTAGEAWIGAAVCLADNVPVATSLNTRKITYSGDKVTRNEPATVPVSLRARMAQLACNLAP